MAIDGFYAQFCEDLILSIVLKDIKQGRYIDVGAHDPHVDSVTKYFYLNGWSGINIEPIAYYYQKLKEVRPRDVNLNIAISNSSGKADFSILHPIGYNRADGLSTFYPESLPSVLRDQFVITSISVETQTLNQVLSEHPMDEIHFLKIDVEGAERSVLESIDLKRFRPWVIVLEATTPMTNIRVDGNWNQILIDAGYVFKLFDGLNVYYVAEERDLALNDLCVEAFDVIVQLNQEHKVLAGEPLFSYETYHYAQCSLLMSQLFCLVFNEKL